MEMKGKTLSEISPCNIVVGSLGTYGFILHTHARYNMTNGWAPYAVFGQRLCVALVQQLAFFIIFLLVSFHFYSGLARKNEAEVNTRIHVKTK